MSTDEQSASKLLQSIRERRNEKKSASSALKKDLEYLRVPAADKR
jgi:hypothetical protein